MKARESAMHEMPPEEVMAYLDGELSTEEAVAVAAHLRECAACAALAEELGGVSRELRAWTVETAPASLERAVRKVAWETVREPRRRVSRKVWAWGGTAAVVTVLFVVGMQMRTPRYKRMVNPPIIVDGLTQSGNSALVQRQSAGVAGMESAGSSYAALSQIAPEAAAPMPPPPAVPARGKAYEPRGPMIARTVSLAVLVRDFDEASSKLTRILVEHRAYEADMTIADAYPPRGLEGGLRIPIGELDSALVEIRALGRVEKETQKGEEVTQQHADLVARLTNAREEETRLRALLQQRTGKIEDVLQVEEEIARVRGEIEQMEAEQQGLEHRVDFASVELRLVEEYAAKLGSPDESTRTRLHNGFVDGVRNAGESLLNLVVFLEEYGPVLGIWAALVGIPGWLLWRRYRRARARVE